MLSKNFGRNWSIRKTNGLTASHIDLKYKRIFYIPKNHRNGNLGSITTIGLNHGREGKNL